jgi:thymidine kinase
MSYTSSYLELFVGPMFSGKTTKIIEKYNKFKFLNIKTMIINHTSDIRYANNSVTNHDLTSIPSTMVNNLFDIINNDELYNKFKICDVILIDEGQFFSDLYEWVKFVIDNYNKKIYISGLDGDINRNKFGHIIDLVPLCDKITKFKSLCSICKNGAKAIFTIKINENKITNNINVNNEGNTILVGGAETYRAVCRSCYLHYSTSNKQWGEIC